MTVSVTLWGTFASVSSWQFLFGIVMTTLIKWLHQQRRKARPQKDMTPMDKASLGLAALSLVLWSIWVYFRLDMRQPDKQNELLAAFLSLVCGVLWFPLLQ